MVNEIVTIYRDGRALNVTRRAYDVVYRPMGYEIGGGELPPINDGEEDLSVLSRSELERMKKDELSDYLRSQLIDFDEKAKKDELIDLIVGE